MLETFKKYCIRGIYTPYPPYHQGDYLEQYFLKFYLKNIEEFKKLERQFIPVCWTDLYLKALHTINDLVIDLSNLDKGKKYFTVSQHDDAPAVHLLPPDTINFSAGGNQPNTIPIPLICSAIPNPPNQKKDIFCSFVGSITAPSTFFGVLAHDIRIKMLKVLKDKPEYLLKPRNWSEEIKKERQDLFLDITSRSKFTLCPRGYGATSYRMYEAMQLGSVPVYIYNDFPFIPYSDKINWDEIAILINQNDMDNLNTILKSVSDEKYNHMINKIKEIYPNYFTLEATCVNILKNLKKLNA